MAILTLDGGWFAYGDALVFKEVDLSVSEGETLCLLGPNGCGKTTLIDCILGIHPLDRDYITLDGHPAGRLSPDQMARIIAFVPQNHVRHFSFSVLDVLLMGRAPYTAFYASPNAADVRMAETVLDALGLTHLKHRDYTRLSGGETQLVMIMRALIQGTPVIAMDEPTAHLDFRHELMVLETIVRLVKERALTLIMATHSPNHAFYLENAGIPVQVAFMNRQRVHLAGSPSTALTEESLAAFYQVKAWVTESTFPGRGTVKQIIPIQTIDGAS
jgi:iron complex transport system ATP-binding protein